MDCFFRIIWSNGSDRIIVKMCRIDHSSIAATSVDNEKVMRFGTPDNGKNLFGLICDDIVARVDLSVGPVELMAGDSCNACFFRGPRSVHGDIFTLLF